MPARHPTPANAYGIDIPTRELIAGGIMAIKLKTVMAKLDVSAGDLAGHITNKKGVQVSRSAITQCCNHGAMPLSSCPNFMDQVESAMRGFGATDADIQTLWDAEDSNVVQMHQLTSNHGKRTSDGMANGPKNHFSETLKEAEMLTPTTMKHFHLFRNPFLDDVQETKDVFMSESHRYAHAAMVDAARNGGFVAICGECGAGKSVMRRKLISELNEAGDVRVIMPRTIDKNELTSGHILDSIILDLDPDGTPRRTKEAKARHVEKALLASSRGGQRHVLIIEEAHDLSVATMKQLKRLWEIEDGYKKVLGIILVGQPELATRLNRNTHPEMREVILRCLIASLDPLSRSDLGEYIALKFDRIGKQAHEVIDPACADAIVARLTVKQHGYSSVYPLYINNLLAKAMNYAAQIGESIVTPEIIQEV